MATYQRRGGKGVKGTLRQQFNYYKKQMFERLVSEEAFSRAMGEGPDVVPVMMFKHLDYDEIFKEGITRLVKGTTTRFYGENAIKLQIESLKSRASKSVQVQRFVDSYIEVFESEAEKQIDDYNEIAQMSMNIRQAFNKLSGDKISYMIKKGEFPSIQTMYRDDRDIYDLFEAIMEALKIGVPKEKIKEIQKNRKALIPGVKRELKIRYGWK